MTQLALKIIPKLSYSAENFLPHSGTREPLGLADELLGSDAFRLLWIEGCARSGKTHLSIYLAARAAAAGKYPRLIEGRDLVTFTDERLAALTVEPDEVLIVDNIDHYLRDVTPGSSGTFVNLIERLRVARARVVCLSTISAADLPCDDHVMSRLRAGYRGQIGNPEEREFEPLLRAMAKQRGILLKERTVKFLTRRLGRDVGALERFLERAMHLSQVLGKSYQLPLLNDALG